MSSRFLIPLMCFIEERGGATLIPNDTISRLWSKLEGLKGEDICVGMQPVPNGVLVVNLIGKEAIDAWDVGVTPKEETDEKERPNASENSNREA